MTSDLGARVATWAIALALLGGNLLVDPAAQASFDAPKRLALVGGAVVAAAALLLAPRPGGERRAGEVWSTWTRRQRATIALAGAAALLVLASAFLSARSGLSRQTLMTLGLLALYLPLGASRALEGAGARTLVLAFLAASVVNAGVSIVERVGDVSLFAEEALGGRETTGGLVGNEGSLALSLSLALVLALAAATGGESRTRRLVAGCVLLVVLAGLALNPTLTALLAALAGGICVVGARFGMKAVVVAAIPLVVGGALASLSPPLRDRLAVARDQAERGDWDALLTYRFGPWAAALEMARANPLLGVGPGVFGAEFVPHRLLAELRHRRRFVVPRETSSYGEAHSEPLQAMAELGAPAASALLLAAVLIGSGTLGRLRAGGGGGGEREDETAILGLVVAGSVASLTWFPLQQPASAPVLLLALGRAWRLLGADEARARTAAVLAPDVSGSRARSVRRSSSRAPNARARMHEDRSPSPASAALRWMAAGVLVAVAVAAQLPRYRGERALARASAGVKARLGAGARGEDEGRETGASPGAGAPWDGPSEGRVQDLAQKASELLPYDSRPLLAAAALNLVSRRSDKALATYGRALALGERAEIDLNVGRAFALQDRRPEAFAAFVRAAWLSPFLIPSLPAAAQPLVSGEVSRLDAELKAGRLAAPPALPALSAQPALPPLSVQPALPPLSAQPALGAAGQPAGGAADLMAPQGDRAR